jgi:hypothetical protein
LSNNIETLLVSNLSFFDDDKNLDIWQGMNNSKFNGLVRAEFINCDIDDDILSSLLLQANGYS